MDDDQVFSQGSVPMEDDRVYGQIVAGVAIAIAILVGLIFVSVF